MTVKENVAIDQRAMDVPGLFVNQFQVSVSATTVRISFAEAAGADTGQYRAAVVMVLQDAEELSTALARSIASLRSQIKPT